jgi:hypothetical protein
VIKKIEPLLFYLSIIIAALPIFCYDYFVTNDGPAHVYNANLIYHYFGEYHQSITALFNFNTAIEPNWIGHLVLIVFKLFLSGAFSEKLLVALILVLFPFAMRKLVIAINKENALIAWLSIPFAFNFILLLGFYNFSMGVVLLLFALNHAVNCKFEYKEKQILWMLFYSVLLYFSHLIVYGLFIIFIFLGMFLKRDHLIIKKTILLIGFQLPLLVLCFLFLRNHSDGGDINALGFEVLLDWLLKARPLLIYNETSEAWFGYVVNILMAYLILLGIVLLRLKKISIKANQNLVLFSVFMLLALVLFFIAPNELVSGGFLNIRMLLLFYIFLIICLSFFTYPIFYIVPAIIITLSSTFYQQWNKFSEIKILSEDTSELTSIVKHLKSGKILIPLNYSQNWLHTNLSNYVAADKLILVLDNYEANTVHFPLKWVPTAQPNPLLGNFSNSLNPSINIMPYEKKTGLRVDYVVRWCYQHIQKDSICEQTNKEIRTYFRLIYTSPKGNAELFERL